MALYSGNLNVLSNSHGLAIPISLTSSQVSGTLSFDITGLLGTGGRTFSSIRAITVDATNISPSPSLFSVALPEIAVTRYINGGSNQILRCPGECRHVQLSVLGGWSGGTLFLCFWSYDPPSENPVAAMSLPASAYGQFALNVSLAADFSTIAVAAQSGLFTTISQLELVFSPLIVAAGAPTPTIAITDGIVTLYAKSFLTIGGSTTNMAMFATMSSILLKSSAVNRALNLVMAGSNGALTGQILANGTYYTSAT